MKRMIWFAGALALAVSARDAHAFCGFYVAAATGDLYNDSSQVVITRDGEMVTTGRNRLAASRSRRRS